MVYDWSGERTRCSRLYRAAAACLFGTVLAAAILLILASRGLGG